MIIKLSDYLLELIHLFPCLSAYIVLTAVLTESPPIPILRQSHGGDDPESSDDVILFFELGDLLQELLIGERDCESRRA